MAPDVTRLHAKLTELRGRDTQFSVFGSSTHRYRLNPCLSEHQVREAETRYGISLPEDYRLFLLRVGNGGAGPYYGMFRLEDSLEHSLDDVRFLQAPFPHVQAWNMSPEELGLDPGRDYAAFDEAYFTDTHAQGALRICHEGCAYYYLLVIAGRERGHMWWDARASDGGIHPVMAPQQPHGRLSFLAWYERWLDQSLGQKS